jgi:hypothetical protein
VTSQDDSGRAGLAREHARLKPTLGDEPGSGYAFHDEARVERMRASQPTPRKASPSTAPTAVMESPFTEIPENDVLLPNAEMQELQDLLDRAAGTPDTRRTTDAPRSTPAKGGAIWSALPPALPGLERPSEPSTPPPLPQKSQTTAPSSGIPTVPLRQRPSLEELSRARGEGQVDVRVLRIEPLVERGAWEQVLAELANDKELSPVLVLLRLIARRELQAAAAPKKGADDGGEAVAAMAAMVQVSPRSPVALLLAKRLLRKNPGRLRDQEATTGVSMGIVVAGIVLGAGLGLLVTQIFL